MLGAEMLNVPGMLMVGAVDRGVGKTRFACSLISRFSSQCGIVGIKVTTVDKADGTCPRGASGCGVCSSLKGHFYITEETNSLTDKDTCRMLTAGASRVFWLRVLRSHLEEGIAALLDIIGDDAISVCESNSLRGPRDITPEATASVCERIVPGLSEMIRAQGWKKTRNAVLSRALAGIRNKTLVINLPGSPKGVKESLEIILDVLPHAVEVMRGGGH